MSLLSQLLNCTLLVIFNNFLKQRLKLLLFHHYPVNRIIHKLLVQHKNCVFSEEHSQYTPKLQSILGYVLLTALQSSTSKKLGVEATSVFFIKVKNKDNTKAPILTGKLDTTQLDNLDNINQLTISITK